MNIGSNKHFTGATIDDSHSNRIDATYSSARITELMNGLAPKAQYKTATITTTWTGASAPYTQTIAVAGITSTDEPIIYPVYSTEVATAITEKEAWGLIGTITTGTDSITCTCFEEHPTVEINIRIKVV